MAVSVAFNPSTARAIVGIEDRQVRTVDHAVGIGIPGEGGPGTTSMLTAALVDGSNYSIRGYDRLTQLGTRCADWRNRVAKIRPRRSEPAGRGADSMGVSTLGGPRGRLAQTRLGNKLPPYSVQSD